MNGIVLKKPLVSWLLPTQCTWHWTILFFLPFPWYRPYVPGSYMCKWPKGNAQTIAALSQIVLNTSSLFLELSIWFPQYSVLDSTFEFIRSWENRVRGLYNDVNTFLLGNWRSSFGTDPYYYQYCYPSLYFLCSFL